MTAGATARGDSLLVLGVSGESLESLTAGGLEDAELRESWSTVERLGEANIAHGHIGPASLRVDRGAGEVALVDLGGGTVAPDQDRRLTDSGQLLATTASAAGTERAVAVAMEASGREQVAALLPYVQLAAFGQPLRRALKAAGIDVDELRHAAARAAGVEPPELAKLRRVTWESLLQVALFVFAGAAVLSFVGGVNFSEFERALRGASWGWIAAGFVVAQLPRVTQAIALRGSVPAELPLGPVYLVQLATSYMNLAVPTSLAGMAVNVRFFQRQGVPPAAAVTSSTINSLAGNVVQAACSSRW
ncbi:MAG TPA: lysylphosphatidylglycerol synthase domain-containing protein [Gaiellales bacterium]|nr:lysylphosphatidylglycerol synthase domain-containing protein [Gaiellales bacterium]